MSKSKVNHIILTFSVDGILTTIQTFSDFIPRCSYFDTNLGLDMMSIYIFIYLFTCSLWSPGWRKLSRWIALWLLPLQSEAGRTEWPTGDLQRNTSMLHAISNALCCTFLWLYSILTQDLIEHLRWTLMVMEVWRPPGAAGFRTLQVYVRPESRSSGTRGRRLTAVSLFPSSIRDWKKNRGDK